MSPTLPRRTLFAALLVSVSACAGPEDPAYLVEEADGGVHLTRIAPLDEVPRLGLSTLWESTSEMWGEPAHAVLGIDHVLVVDPSTTRMHVLDRETGSPVAAIGREGEGPGEWPDLEGGTLVGDTILATSDRFQGIRLYSLEGEEIGSLATEIPGLRLETMPRGRVLATSPVVPQSFLLTPAAGTVEEIRLGPDPYPAESFGSCRHTVVTPSGFARLTCVAGRLEILGANGTQMSRVEWQQPPGPATEEELDAYIARFYEVTSGGRPMSRIVEMQLARVREQVRIRPLFLDLVQDQEGESLLVVEQWFDGFGTTPARLHLLGPDGRHRGIIETDLFLKSVSLRGNTLVMLIRDPETDLISVRAAQLTQPIPSGASP